MTLHVMSDKELTRLEVLRDLTSGRLTAMAAAELLGLEHRQVQRLAKAYQDQGATALISKKRGRPSNRQMPESLKAQTLAVIRERYADFGPTLAAEKLREVHGITIGRETLRLWMLEAGLWADRQKRRGRVYQPRYRRECVGDDGSPRRQSSRTSGWAVSSPLSARVKNPNHLVGAPARARSGATRPSTCSASGDRWFETASNR